MKKTGTKLLSLLLTLSMLLSLVPVMSGTARADDSTAGSAVTAGAAVESTDAAAKGSSLQDASLSSYVPNLSDLSEAPWAEAAMRRWTQYGVLSGTSKGVDPNGTVTRAQVAQIFSKLLGLSDASITQIFYDLPGDAWYSTAIRKAVSAGILNGVSEHMVAPDQTVTREQFFTMFARAMGLKPQDTTSGSPADGSSWATRFINALTDRSYVKGDGKGVNALMDITRAGVMSLLDQAIGTYANVAGATVQGSNNGMVLVTAPDVTVTGAVQDIVVADGAKGANGVANVTLKDAIVTGQVSLTTAADLHVDGASAVANVVIGKNAANSSVEVSENSVVAAVSTEASGTSVSGKGLVSEVSADGAAVNSTSVSTANTVLKDGNTVSTVVASVPAAAPAAGGSSGSGSTGSGSAAASVSSGSAPALLTAASNEAASETYDVSLSYRSSLLGTMEDPVHKTTSGADLAAFDYTAGTVLDTVYVTGMQDSAIGSLLGNDAYLACSVSGQEGSVPAGSISALGGSEADGTFSVFFAPIDSGFKLAPGVYTFSIEKEDGSISVDLFTLTVNAVQNAIPVFTLTTDKGTYVEDTDYISASFTGLKTGEQVQSITISDSARARLLNSISYRTSRDGKIHIAAVTVPDAGAATVTKFGEMSGLTYTDGVYSSTITANGDAQTLNTAGRVYLIPYYNDDALPSYGSSDNSYVHDALVTLTVSGSAVKTRTVTFNYNDEGVTPNQFATVPYGTAVAKPDDPTREGYTFAGWYYGLVRYSFSLPVYANFTLTAHWTKNAVKTYTVKFDRNGGLGLMSSQTFSSDSTGSLNANLFFKLGSDKFAGWSLLKDAAGTALFADRAPLSYLVEAGAFDESDTVTLYAQWSSDPQTTKRTVTFDYADGETTPMAVEVDYGVAVAKPADPTREGYTFDGWYYGRLPYVFSTPVVASFTLTAHWKEVKVDPESYTVTFHYDQLAYGDEDVKVSVESGKTVTKQDIDPKDGYDVKGWCTRNWLGQYTLYNFDNAVTGDLDLYARYIPHTYTVTFNANGGTGASRTQTGFTYGEKKHLDRNTFTRTGYVFTGWDTEPDGTGISYADREVVSYMSEEDNGNVTLYAQWAFSSNSWIITFNANGGTGYMAQQSLPKNGSVKLNWNYFERDGYEFDGWNTKADGTGNAYYDRDDINGADFSGNVTLYAQWVHEYTVILNANGGKFYPGEADESETLEWSVCSGETVMEYFEDEDLPRRDKAVFRYWATRSRTFFWQDYTYTEYDLNKPVTGDLTLYAVWETAAEGDAVYEVRHLKQNVEGDDYELALTEYLSGTPGEATEARAMSYEGFTAQTVEQKTIAEDGSTLVEIKYDRNTVSFTYWRNRNTDDTAHTTSERNVVYGSTDWKAQEPTGSWGYLDHTFIGWNTMRDGSGETVNISKPMLFTEEHMDLYAQWVETGSKNVTVTFLPNGAAALPYIQSIPAGVATALDENTFTRPGLTFVGWNTMAEPGEGAKAYYDGETVTLGEDLTLYAQWVKVYTVTFDFDDDSSKPLPVHVAPDTTVADSAEEAELAQVTNPTRDGYRFEGWYKRNLLTRDEKYDLNATRITGDVTLYAKWAQTEYTVEFDSQGGSEVASQTRAANEKATEPAAPTRDGYTFDGWYTSTSRILGRKFNFSTPVIADFTLYARWSPITYSVRFVANGGSGSMADQSFTYGSAKALSANKFTRTGYVFTGWNTMPDGNGTSYGNSESVKNLTAVNGGTVQLHAQWSNTTDNWVITFHANGGTGSMPKQSYPQGGSVALNPNQFERTGYAFVGWADSRNGKVVTMTETDGSVYFKEDYTLKADVTLYAVWAEQLKVTFNTNGGTFDTYYSSTLPRFYESGATAATVYVTPESTVDLALRTAESEGKIFVPDAVMRESFVPDERDVNAKDSTTEHFLYWATRSRTFFWQDYTYTPFDFSEPMTEGVTLYAVWQQHGKDEAVYTVQHWKQALDGDGKAATDEYVLADTDYVTLPNELTNEAYYLLPLETSYEGFRADRRDPKVAPFTGNTINIYYDRISYTITFDPNGGSFGESGTSSVPVVYGSSQWAPATDPTRDGYAFDGWFTKADGGDQVFTRGEMLYTADTTLYAQWAEHGTAAAIYLFGVGGADADGKLVRRMDVKLGEQITVPENPFTRAGYVFLGWSESEYATEAEYQPGGSFTPDSTMILLSAVWESAVTFRPNGGAFKNSDEAELYGSCKIGEVYEGVVPGVTRTGYTFKGWATDRDGHNMWSFESDKVTEGLVLYAIWTADVYTVSFRANGGTGRMADQTFIIDSVRTLSDSEYYRSGYTFVGWNTAADGSGTAYAAGTQLSELAKVLAEADAETMPLYAQWERSENVFSVSFAPNGGKGSMDQQVFVKGTPAKLKANEFTREGYVFAGWCDDPNGEGKFYADEEEFTATEDFTLLYAQWEKACTITLIAGDGAFKDGEKTAAVAILDGTIVKPEDLPEPLLSGAVFTGWVTRTRTFPWEEYVETPFEYYNFLTEDLTLYATWLSAPDGMAYYTVNHWLVGDTKKLYDSDTLVGVIGEATKARPYAIEGYAELTPAQVKQQEIKADGTTVVDINYEPNTYTIFFHRNRNTTDDKVTSKNLQYLTIDWDAPSYKTDFDGAEHIFLGWFTKPSGGEWIDTSEGKEMYFTEETHLYAQWALSTVRYKVTYDPSGGQGSAKTDTVKPGAVVKLPDCPFTRRGYDFESWWDGENTWYNEGAEVKVLSDMTFYVDWTLSDDGPVTLDPNGGMLKGSDEIEVSFGGVYPTLPTPTREGYAFDGWRLGSESGMLVKAGDTVNSRDTLVAAWHALTYQVTLNRNYGITIIPTVLNVTYGSTYGEGSIARSSERGLTTPTRSGYNFIGWFTARTGGTRVTNADYLISAGNHTLYAQWTQQSIVSLPEPEDLQKIDAPATSSGTVDTKVTDIGGTSTTHNFVVSYTSDGLTDSEYDGEIGRWITLAVPLPENADQLNISYAYTTPGGETYPVYPDQGGSSNQLLRAANAANATQRYDVFYFNALDRDYEGYLGMVTATYSQKGVAANAETVSYLMTVRDITLLPYNLASAEMTDADEEIDPITNSYGDLVKIDQSEFDYDENKNLYTADVSFYGVDENGEALGKLFVRAFTLTGYDFGSYVGVALPTDYNATYYAGWTTGLADPRGYARSGYEAEPDLETESLDEFYFAVPAPGYGDRTAYLLAVYPDGEDNVYVYYELSFTNVSRAGSVTLHYESDTQVDVINVVGRGESFTLPQASREGYRLVAWAEELESGGEVSYQPGAPVTVSSDYENRDFYAKWEKVTTYSIGWVADDGKTVLAISHVAEGDTPVYPGSENPTKEATAQYTYTFAGWTPVIIPATQDANYTAKFDATVRSYTVKWYDGNGQYIEQTVPYGTTLQYPNSEDPGKTKTEYYSYVFTGWVIGDKTYDKNAALPTVTGDVNCYADFMAVPADQHAVTFMIDGARVSSTTVSDGVYLERPMYYKSGYALDGWYTDAGCTKAWDFDTDQVTKDLNLYAKWVEIGLAGANLYDNATGAKGEEVGKYTALAYERNDGVVAVTLTVDDLLYHRNGDGDWGYWAGLAILAPDGATQYKAAIANQQSGLPATLNAVEASALDADVDGENSGYAFYVNVPRGETRERYVAIQWFNGVTPVTNITVYDVTITNKTAASDVDTILTAAVNYSYGSSYRVADHFEYSKETNGKKVYYMGDKVLKDSDVSRFLGALYLNSTAKASEIVYDGVAYTWNTKDGSARVASNWKNVDKNSKVTELYDVLYNELFISGLETITIDGEEVALHWNAPRRYLINALAYTYSDYTYKGAFAVKGYDDLTYAPRTSEPSDMMNDLARFLGGLYRGNMDGNGPIVVELKFDGVSYTWDVKETRKGSNWVDSKNGTTTLVSVITAKYNAGEIASVDLTIVDSSDDIFPFTVRIAGTSIVTWDDENGSFKKSAVPTGMALGENVLKAPLDSKGRIFDGWYEDMEYTKQVNADTVVTEDVTFHAKWKEIELAGANLYDNATGAEGEDVGKYTALAYERNDGVVAVTLTVDDLIYHKNGDGNWGYWAGLAILAPKGAENFQYAFSSEAFPADTSAVKLTSNEGLDKNADGKRDDVNDTTHDGAAIYLNVPATGTAAKYLLIQWLDANGDEITGRTQYQITVNAELSTGFDAFVAAIMNDDTVKSNLTLGYSDDKYQFIMSSITNPDVGKLCGAIHTAGAKTITHGGINYEWDDTFSGSKLTKWVYKDGSTTLQLYKQVAANLTDDPCSSELTIDGENNIVIRPNAT